MASFIVLVGALNSISPEVSRLTSRIAKNCWHGQIVFVTALTVVCVTSSRVVLFGITISAFGLIRLGFVDDLIGTAASLPAFVAYVYMGVLAGGALQVSAAAVVPE